MSKPFTNDFGQLMPKHKAREVLLAHCWRTSDSGMWYKLTPALVNHGAGLTLREAWAVHKLCMATEGMTDPVQDFQQHVKDFGVKVDTAISAFVVGLGSMSQGVRSP
jgi:hypothetical protein